MHPTETTRKISFFMGIGFVGFLAVLIGFGKTLPPAMKDAKTPALLYIHGAFAFSWLCLFIIQATLMNNNNFRLHKILGVLGIFIAIGAALTMLPAGVYQVQRELQRGAGEATYSSIVGVVTSAV